VTLSVETPVSLFNRRRRSQSNHGPTSMPSLSWFDNVSRCLEMSSLSFGSRSWSTTDSRSATTWAWSGRLASRRYRPNAASGFRSTVWCRCLPKTSAFRAPMTPITGVKGSAAQGSAICRAAGRLNPARSADYDLGLPKCTCWGRPRARSCPHSPSFRPTVLWWRRPWRIAPRAHSHHDPIGTSRCGSHQRLGV
jgi:hypothetical protein